VQKAGEDHREEQVHLNIADRHRNACRRKAPNQKGICSHKELGNILILIDRETFPQNKDLLMTVRHRITAPPTMDRSLLMDRRREGECLHLMDRHAEARHHIATRRARILLQ
jgi:hypothetical protein